MTQLATQTFTLDEARARLPLVRSIVSDIVEQYAALRAILDQYAQHVDESGELLEGAESEAWRLEQEIGTREAAIDGALAELTELGAEFKGFDPGLVDFPGIRDGRPVCWCWKYGEDEISHWHGVDEGFSSRQSL